MELQTFLSNNDNTSKFDGKSVICLTASKYPLLFCQQFVRYLASACDREIVSSEIGVDNYAAVMASLQSTFLGQRSWYWLRSDDGLSSKAYQAWREYLLSYCGPNKLIFFTCKPIKKAPSSWCIICLPDQVERSIFPLISQIAGIKRTIIDSDLYKNQKSISLDTAVLLTQYGTLAGNNWKQFCNQWLSELVLPETSLFVLSQALFGRRVKLFFTQWKQLVHSYAPQFWIAFWSEQLWRAYCYVRLQKAGKYADAKKIGYRLPFSFLNRDWRNYSLRELCEAHHFLYGVDFHLKNGGNEVGLDLFYAKFFQN